MNNSIKVGDVVRVTVVYAGSLRGLCEVEPIVPNELMHTTPEGLTGADATWAAGVMERDRAQRNAALKRAEAAEAKLAEVTKERDLALSLGELGIEFRRTRDAILGVGSKGGAETVIDAWRKRGERLRATMVERDEVTKERDSMAATLVAFTPDDADSPMPSPVSFKSAETPSQNRAFLWIVNACIRLCMMEVKRQHPEKQNRLTFPILMGDDTEASWSLTLRREPWESLMEAQRDEARAERDALRAQLAPERPIGAEGPWQAKATAAAAEILRETTTRQPDGYDPGARPVGDRKVDPVFVVLADGRGAIITGPATIKHPTTARVATEDGAIEDHLLTSMRLCAPVERGDITPEKEADPRSWAREGLWTVCEGGYRPGRLLLNRDPWGDGRPSWLLTSTSGEEFGSDLMTRRPATPEETARFEAELARNMAPAPIPLAVGQRWVHRAHESEPALDDIITSFGTNRVRTKDGYGSTGSWDLEGRNGFHSYHSRLRDPSELEPAPEPGWGPKQVDEVTTVTSGPLGDPAPEPLVKLMGDGYGGAWFGPASMFNETKTSLPVVPATCGECEHATACTECRWKCGEVMCSYPMSEAKASRHLAPPDECPLRKPSDELRSKETP